jgi:hypothetical protein
MAYFVSILVFAHLIMMTQAVTAGKLQIQSPLSLRKKFPNGKIVASYANFGFIPYGHTMVSNQIVFHLKSNIFY